LDYFSNRRQVHQVRARQQDSIVILWNFVMLSAAKHLDAPTSQALRCAQGDNDEASSGDASVGELSW
jgi:hypothetical protein